MDVAELVTIGQATGCSPVYLDDHNILLSHSRGLVACDTQSGLQKHIWSPVDYHDAEAPVFAVHAKSGTLAFAPQGPSPRVHVLRWPSLDPVDTITLGFEQPVQHLAFSSDAERLSIVSAAPEGALQVWNLLSHTAEATAAVGQRSSGLGASFFPLNPNVIAVAGPQALRLVYLEPSLASYVVRQSDVDLLVMGGDEAITASGWTPNGTLLLGTSCGRLLSVVGAAPPVGLACSLGHDPSHKAQLLLPAHVVAPALAAALASPAAAPAAAARTAGGASSAPPALASTAPPPSPTISISGLAVLKSHVVLAVETSAGGGPGTNTSSTGSSSTHGGGGGGDCQLVWLDAGSALDPVARLPLPVSTVAAFRLSPNRQQLLVASRGGEALTCPAAPPRMDRSAPLLHMLSHHHTQQLSSCAPLHGSNAFATGSADGSVRVWHYSTPPPPPRSNSRAHMADATSNGANTLSGAAAAAAATAAPSAGIAIRLAGVFSLGCPVAFLQAVHRDQPAAGDTLLLAGCANGSLVMMDCALMLRWPQAEVNGDDTNPAALVASRDLIAQQGVTAATALGAVVHVDTSRASSSSTKAVRIWDAPVTSLAVSPDGVYAAAASSDINRIAFLRLPKALTGRPAARQSAPGEEAPTAAVPSDSEPPPTPSASAGQYEFDVMGFYPLERPVQVVFAPADPNDEEKRPLVVAATAATDVLVLALPHPLVPLPPDMSVPALSLHVAGLRSPSAVTAMAVVPAAAAVGGGVVDSMPVTPSSPAPGSPAPVADGHFFVFAACMDKSIRRFRMYNALMRQPYVGTGGGGLLAPGAQQQQPSSALTTPATGRMTAAPAVPVPRVMMPEFERTAELLTRARDLSVDASGGRLAVSTCEGCTAVYDLPGLQLQGRWLLHGLLAGGTATACLCDDNVLVSAGKDGVAAALRLLPPMSRMDRLLAPQSSTSSFKAVGRPGAGGGDERHPLASAGVRSGRLVPFCGQLQAAPPLAVTALAAGQSAPDWRTAREQTVARVKHAEVAQYRKAVHDKLEAWREQLRRLRAANATVDAAAPEKLSDGDFVVDTELAAALAAEAQARLAAVAAAEERKLAALELAAERLRGECWDAALVKPSTLLALEQYTPVSSLDAAAMAAIGAAGILGPPKVGQVSNYPIMALTAREERRLKKVTFLRRVEQEEWHSRPPTQRGQLVTLYEHTGPVTAGGAATATAAAGGAAGVRVDGNQAPGGSPSPPGSPGGGVARDEGDDEMTFAPVVGCSVENGVTGLLYHELQLHCLTRKVAQAVLMSGAEVAAVHAAFNARFDELHARKEVCLGRIEDDVHRVLEIQAKLEEESLPVGPTHHGWQPIEQPETLLAVADSDVVGITRYVSEEEAEVERLRKEEEAAAEARAAADDARRRALSDMMPGGLVAKMEEVKFQPPAREEWMDVIPRSQLTKAQRLELAEWEARARAVAEEKEAFVRGLEQERKLLEIEVMETVAGFNAALQALAEERTRVDVCVAGLEFKCLELAAGLEDDEHRRGVVEKLEAAAGRVADRRQRRQQLIEDLSAGLEEVLAEYDVLHGVERRMDRAFKKSYSQMDQVWPLLYKVYRDRRHAPTGNRVASPAEMMKEEGGGGDSGDVEPRKTSDQQDGDEGRDGGGGGGRSVAPLTTALARQLMWCGTGELGPQEPARPEVDVSPVFLPAVAPVYAVVPPPSSLLQPEAGAAAAGSGGGGGLTERHIAASLSEAAADVSNSRNNVVAAATGDDGSPGSAIVQAGAAARSPSAAGAAAAAGAHRVSRLPLSDRLQALTQRGGRPLHVLIDDFLDAQSIASRYQQLGLLGLGGAPGRGSGTSGGGGGISRSSSVRYDGRHGGAAAADADSDASAADAAAAEEEEYYSDPFATSALVRYFRPSVPSAAPVTAGAAAASATSPDHSPTRPAAVEDGREDGGGSSPAATSTAGQQLQQPFTLDDKPDGVDLTTWEHVLAWRDSRMQLQAQVQGVWVVLCQLALQLDVAEAEALRLEGQLESDMGAAADTTDALTRDSFDMLHSFTVKSSQMELPRGMVQDLFNTVLLHGFVATKLNDAVRGHNNDKLAQLASVKKLRGAIHSGRWRCGAADIQIRHTADMLREIQILNVSREAISALQAGRNDAAADEEAPGKAGGKAAPMNREEAIAESMAFFRRGHKRNIDMRSAKLAGRKESAQIAVQEREELEALLGAAEDAINSSSHLAAQAEVQQRFERAAQERLLKSVKSNNQLKSIAEAQQAHIAALRSELSARMERAFPVLPPPGKGSPRARAASAAAGSAPPDPAVAALTTFVPPPSHGERSSGGSAALSPTNRPTSSSAGPNRTTPLNMFASSPTTSSPVMAAGAMRSRTTPRTGSADASATVQLPPISSPSAASQLINAYGGSPKKGGSPLSPKLVRPTTAAPGAAAASRPSPSLMPPQQLVLEAPHSPKAVLARPTLNRRH